MKIEDLDKKWDLIVIGGGITGAGIFREAVRAGLKTLLLEQMDYAWGTSSRSSKLVHGGLRYLKYGRLLLTRNSVKERERLLEEAPGLVEPLDFLMPVYQGWGPGKHVFEAALTVYDLLAHKKRHKFYEADEFLSMAPYFDAEGLVGGFQFMDAQVDDARLVLRLINEGVQFGGCALNYTSVQEIVRDELGNVVGVIAQDTETEKTGEFSSRAVINATGVWAEKLHPSPDRKRRLRPLRGSHLVFPASVLPFNQAMSFFHPSDNRPVCATPWEGGVVFGTTDVDHRNDLWKEPSITEQEVLYLMDALQLVFPSLQVSLDDCISTFAGVRPVLGEGKLAASKESREHVVWVEQGLVTITGGKLTTFRRLAWDTLKAAKPFLGSVEPNGRDEQVFSKVPSGAENDFGLSYGVWRRLFGRYGPAAYDLPRAASPEDLNPIPDTETLWAELPFVAAHEQVRHLDDLLMRRVRIGLMTPEGGKEHLRRIRSLCESSLPWDDKRWEEEINAYLLNWRRNHAQPVRHLSDPEIAVQGLAS